MSDIISPEQELYNKIQKLYEEKREISQKIETEMEILKTICRHPRRENKEEYIEGSYYDKAEYSTFSVCQLCGDKKLIKRELGHYA